MNNCKQLFVSHDFRSHSMLFAFCLIYNWDALNLTHRERYSYQIMVLIVLMNISLATFDRLRAHLGFLTHQWDCHGFIAERDLLNENSRQTITYFACMNAATFDNAYVYICKCSWFSSVLLMEEKNNYWLEWVLYL